MKSEQKIFSFFAYIMDSIQYWFQYLIRNEISDINLIRICGGDIESTNHFFFHTPEFIVIKQALFDNNQTIDKMLLSQNKSKLTHSFLYHDPTRKSNVN